MHPGSRSHTVTTTLALLVRVAAVVIVVAVVAVAAGAAVGSGATASDETGPFEGDDRGTIERETPDETTRDGVGPLTRCFDGKGYPISIGDEGATIDALVHLSVLTDPAVGNEFGLEAAGAIGGDPIVTLAAGVRLTAREAIADGVNPFAAFDVLYTYELRLPMFDGAVDDTEYRDEGSPITSAAGAIPC